MSEDARQKVEKMVSVEKEQFAEVNALGSQKKPWQKVEKMVSVEKEQFAEVNALGSQKKPWQKMQPTQSGYEYDCNRLKRRVRLLQNAESDEYDANENVCGIIEAITNQALICTGHFGTYQAQVNQQRQKRRVRLLQNAESDEYDANENVCGIIEAITNQALISTTKDRLDNWSQVFKFGDTSITFKLDSGADINVLPKSSVEKINPRLMKRLVPNNLEIQAFGGYALDILGHIKLKLINKEEMSTIVDIDGNEVFQFKKMVRSI
ncbi:hypothetical protein M8J77_013383 [Diaphorina citri]|nr:hypothetical protein M8J77_013383 [Diaphorina citri]